jgi:cullin-associated NEDD8-dissociated protein 1
VLLGYKLGPYLNVIIPRFKQFCAISGDTENPDADLDHEIVEVCLNSFESFIRKCPKEMTEFVSDLLNLSSELLCYDPNYSYDDADLEEMQDPDGEWDSDDWGNSQHELSDDSSWKVRRASIRVIDAIAKCRPEMLSHLYDQIVKKLVERFKEREENVKSDIFSTFSNIVRCAVIGDTSQSETLEMEMPVLIRTRSSTDVLGEQIPVIIKALLEQIDNKSLKIKASVVNVFLNLAFVLPGALQKYFGEIFPKLTNNFDQQNSSLKIDILIILKRLMRTSMVPQIFLPYAADLVKLLLFTINDDYYKVCAESLRTTSAFFRVLRIDTNKPLDPKFQPYLNEFYDVIHGRLKTNDIDHEVNLIQIFSHFSS